MRPWPFGTVRAERTRWGAALSWASGVIRRRALTSPGGSSGAKRDGEIGHQGRLVRFYGERVIALPVPDGLAGRPLGELRICRDHAASERLTFRQREGARDLVAVRLSLQPEDRSAEPAGEGRRELHPRAADLAGRGETAQALAIQGRRPERGGARIRCLGTALVASASRSLKK